jgi:hypothetical protein
MENLILPVFVIAYVANYWVGALMCLFIHFIYFLTYKVMNA